MRMRTRASVARASMHSARAIRVRHVTRSFDAAAVLTVLSMYQSTALSTGGGNVALFQGVVDFQAQ